MQRPLQNPRDPSTLLRPLRCGERVLVACPVKGVIARAEALNIVYGINHHLYESSLHRLVTAASCTTNCLAPVVKVVHEHFNNPRWLDHHTARCDQYSGCGQYLQERSTPGAQRLAKSDSNNHWLSSGHRPHPYRAARPSQRSRCAGCHF